MFQLDQIPKRVESREIFLLISQTLWTRLLLSYLWHLGFILHYRLNLLLIKALVTLPERQCDISMLFYHFKQDSMKKLTFSQSNYKCQNCRNPSFNYCHLESEKCWRHYIQNITKPGYISNASSPFRMDSSFLKCNESYATFPHHDDNTAD